MNKEEMQMKAFELIGYAGDATSCFFEALAKAKAGDFDSAATLMKQGEESMLESHHKQTDLLSAEARGDNFEIPLLMIHAQDHLMNAVLTQKLVEEIIELHRGKSE